MQNALKHVNVLFKGTRVRGALPNFMDNIEEQEEVLVASEEMLDKYDAHKNNWLRLTFL